MDSIPSPPSKSNRRLFIKEMVMRNFKSYGGEQRVGPFHKNFSAVVGPNGSGKSNVIDSMLFVFGKRAKQMRLNHQNLDSASVSVHFQEIIDLDGKNEAESYMLKDLSHMKWKEKATRLASEDAASHVVQLQTNVSTMEEKLKSERETIKETSKTLKELESVHNKNMKRQEELDNDLRSCKEKFKEFEREDVKHREDFKHREDVPYRGKPLFSFYLFIKLPLNVISC